MVRFISMVLATFAAALHVVLGVRSEHHPVWWEEHPASAAEKLQELLRARLVAADAVATAEAQGDTEAQERTLRERVARIREDWPSTSASVCHQQLGRVMDNLTLACERSQPQPKADWLLDYYVPALPTKTCTESISDIFTLGSELVETLHIARDAVAALDVAGKMLRRYQALSFLRSWLVKLTETQHHALLWAGFWDGDPEKRTTKAKLFKFAKDIDHATVHPDSFLGQAIQASENLDACEDAQTSALVGNMWSIASMSFVLGMHERAQGTVIALVNKQITGERNLSESVLSAHELPTVGIAAWGLGFWSPKVMVVDLMGTCDETSPALQKQLFARLPFWAKHMKHWSPEAFAMRSRLHWQCIDCSGACSLDEALAEHVEKLVKAKEEPDRKDVELHEVVSPHYAAMAALGPRQEEVDLADKLIRSWDKYSDDSRSMALIKLHRYKQLLQKEQKSRFWQAVPWREKHTSQHLRVEQLLRQKRILTLWTVSAAHP